MGAPFPSFSELNPNNRMNSVAGVLAPFIKRHQHQEEIDKQYELAHSRLAQSKKMAEHKSSERMISDYNKSPAGKYLNTLKAHNKSAPHSPERIGLGLILQKLTSTPKGQRLTVKDGNVDFSQGGSQIHGGGGGEEGGAQNPQPKAEGQKKAILRDQEANSIVGDKKKQEPEQPQPGQPEGEGGQEKKKTEYFDSDFPDETEAADSQNDINGPYGKSVDSVLGGGDTGLSTGAKTYFQKSLLSAVHNNASFKVIGPPLQYYRGHGRGYKRLLIDIKNVTFNHDQAARRRLIKYVAATAAHNELIMNVVKSEVGGKPAVQTLEKLNLATFGHQPPIWMNDLIPSDISNAGLMLSRRYNKMSIIGKTKATQPKKRAMTEHDLDLKYFPEKVPDDVRARFKDRQIVNQASSQRKPEKKASRMTIEQYAKQNNLDVKSLRKSMGSIRKNG